MISNFKRAWKFFSEGLIYLFKDFPFESRELNYDEYWRKRGLKRRSAKERYKIIASMMEAGSRVLDIGCGNGELLEFLRKEKNITGKGVDISQAAAEAVKSRGFEIEIADITKPSFKIKSLYECIILSEILEHITNPEEVLIKTKGKFKKALFVSIPNTGYILDRLRLLLGRFPAQYVYHPQEHLRFWTVKDFLWWSNQIGFKVKVYKGTSGIPRLWRYFPRIFARQVLYVLIPKEEKT